MSSLSNNKNTKKWMIVRFYNKAGSERSTKMCRPSLSSLKGVEQVKLIGTSAVIIKRCVGPWIERSGQVGDLLQLQAR